MNQQPYHLEPQSQFRMICGIPVWMNFAFLVIGVCGLPAIAATVVSNESYLEYWRTPKYFELPHLLITFATIVALAVGFFTTSSPARHFEVSPVQRTNTLNNWAIAAVCLTFFGYIVWFGAAISRGLSFWHLTTLLTGGEQGLAYSMRREQMETISGVTTMTQFGPAAIVLVLLSFPDRPYTRRFIVAALLGLAAIRALLNSERLAVLELAIPAAVVLVRVFFIGSPITQKTQMRLMVAPAILAIGVFLLFTGMESLRSWGFYSKTSDSLLAFSAARFGGYYITSLNNGALCYDMLDNIPFPYFLLTPFWGFPLVKSSGYSYPSLMRVDPMEDFEVLLRTYGNYEFNNPCGNFLPILDFGLIGGLVVMLIIGMVCGLFYSSFKSAGLMGLLFYPIMILFALDLPRIFYIAMPRSLPTLVFLLMVVVLCGARYQNTLLYANYVEDRD